MEGKKNIVFGFLFLVITASLGPYMVVTLLPDVEKASLEKQKVLSDLQLIVMSEFENTETLEAMTADEIAKANSEAILALNTNLNARITVDTIKGGPHAQRLRFRRCDLSVCHLQRPRGLYQELLLCTPAQETGQ